MKTLKLLAAPLAGLFLAASLAGCATQKIDWAARVAVYTMDQAIADYGPPDKQARLGDGTMVAEWLTRRGYHTTYVSGFYYNSCWPGFYGPIYPSYMDSYSPDYYLRLTFGADGKLKTWKRFSK